MESSPLLQIHNSASIGFHFTSLKWQEPHLYSTQLYRITEIASIVLSPAEYFTEETNRFSRALLFPNHGIKFCKNCFTYQAALSGFVKAPHLAGSEKAILSGSVSKILHFCIAEQKARATFVNSSKQRWLRIDCTAQNLRYTVSRFDEAHQRNVGKKRTARNPSGTNRMYSKWKNYRSCRTSARLWKRS